MRAIKEITSTLDMQLGELENFFGTEFTGELKQKLISLIKAYPEFIAYILKYGSGMSLDSLIQLFQNKIAKERQADFSILISQPNIMDSSPLDDVMFVMIILAILNSKKASHLQTEMTTTNNSIDRFIEIYQCYKSEMNSSNRAKVKFKL